MKGVLPAYFREKQGIPDIEAVRIMHDMQYAILEHYSSRSEFLVNMQELHTIENVATYDIYQGVMMYIDSLIWAKLTDRQKDGLRSRYFLVDPGTNEMEVPGLIDLDSIRTTFTKQGFALVKSFDFKVLPNTVKFFTEISTELWEQLNIQATVMGKPFPISVSILPMYLSKAVFSEDWYYKRAGILVGIDEFTAPEKVISVIQLKLDGPTEDTISALLAAYSGYGISLRKDKISAISEGEVVSETEKYAIPVFTYDKTTVRVYPGKVMELGEPLFDTVYLVNDNKFPDWAVNSAVTSVLRAADSAFEDKLRVLISDNERLLWGMQYPIRLSQLPDVSESIGLWTGAPVSVVPPLIFKVGEDAVVDEYSAVNMTLYNTFDMVYDMASLVVSYAAGVVTINIDSGAYAEALAPDSSGVFVSSATGISGRIFDAAILGSWEGTITQNRGEVTVLAESSSEILKISFSGGWNEGLAPEEEDWVWFEDAGYSGEWHKARIYTIITDDEGVVIGCTAKWFGNAVPAAGVADAIVLRSFDGEPYTGVDAVRIDSFGTLLMLVSRHIEVVIMDSSTVPDGEDILYDHRGNLSMWKAYIMVKVPTEDFLEIRNKLRKLEV